MFALTFREGHPVDGDEADGVRQDVIHDVPHPLHEVAAPPPELGEAAYYPDKQLHQG